MKTWWILGLIVLFFTGITIYYFTVGETSRDPASQRDTLQELVEQGTFHDPH